MEFIKGILDAIGGDLIIPAIKIAGPLLAIWAAKGVLGIVHAAEKKGLIDLDEKQEAQVRSIVAGAVNHTNQTFVDNLKLKRKKGKLKGTDMADAMKLTLKEVKDDLKELGTAKAMALLDAGAAGEKVIRKKVEEALASGLKSTPKA